MTKKENQFDIFRKDLHGLPFSKTSLGFQSIVFSILIDIVAPSVGNVIQLLNMILCKYSISLFILQVNTVQCVDLVVARWFIITVTVTMKHMPLH